jgi:hypothetical protein
MIKSLKNMSTGLDRFHDCLPTDNEGQKNDILGKQEGQGFIFHSSLIFVKNKNLIPRTLFL